MQSIRIGGKERLGRFALAIGLACSLVAATPGEGICRRHGGLDALSNLLSRKPLYVIGNVEIRGGLTSLFAEMKITAYNDVDIDSMDISQRALDDATVLILIDRQSGPIPDTLEYLVPCNARNIGGDSAAFCYWQRTRNRNTVFITAPSRESLVDFINLNLRQEDDPNSYSCPYPCPPQPPLPMTTNFAPSPPTPFITFPTGTVRSTRPPIFFLIHKSTDTVTYDIQVSPVGREKDYARGEFPDEDGTYQTPEGGWIAFGQDAREASRFEMEEWGVKPPANMAKHNMLMMVYHPEADVVADATYTVRMRGHLAEIDKAGHWSSEEETTKIIVPRQPADLGRAEMLTQPSDADEMYPSYSNDGGLLLYATNRAARGGRSIWEIYADSAAAPGAGSNRLTQSNRRSRDFHPVWGPVSEDGQPYTTFQREEFVLGGKRLTSIWCVAVPTPERPNPPIGYTRLTNFEESCTWPTWSRDGKKLAFCKDSGHGDSEIWVYEAGRNRVVTTGITPAWAPDNKTLYYSSNANGAWDIWKINLATGEQVAVTTGPGQKYSPAVNPTGNGDVAYVSTAAGNEDIWVLHQGNTVQLTQWLGDDTNPCWTPDGKRIVFATTRFGSKLRYSLASIDPYGSAVAGPGAAPDAGGIHLPPGVQ